MDKEEKGEGDLEFVVNEKTGLDPSSPDAAQIWGSEVITYPEFTSGRRQDRIVHDLYEKCADIINFEDSSFFWDQTSGGKNR